MELVVRKAKPVKTDKNEKKPAESKEKTKRVTKEESNNASPVKKSRGRPKGRRGRPKKDSPEDSEDNYKEEEV
ncbi:hypothetical protein WA026_007586 [Henosepilachna vigintioctopunctata]|uniref:Uncharacterized protein n=1 Tax=Henosepilachna vigintioctopunctata TaxID=420089 RepID=A0AAW1UMB0_9CUCU